MSAKFKTGLSFSLLMLTWLAIGSFALTSWLNPLRAHVPAKTSTALALDAGTNFHPSQGFADLVARVQPAVVNVSAQRKLKVSAPPGQHSFGGHPSQNPFEDFFQQFFGAPSARSAPHPALPRSLPPSSAMPPSRQRGGSGPGAGTSVGSGFIIDSSGLVVTNHHVVNGTSGITVTLQDGRSVDAELVGSDSKTDIAVLRLQDADAAPYPALKFGSSDATRVGDWVIAIGNPFGLGGTVTTGIVSARGRDIQSGPYDDFLQIDAPINQGNSGGPLFNTRGEVIGINTAIFSPHGGSVGIGFAIPASLADPIIADLRDSGSVQRGWLGVTIQPVTEAIAQSLELKSASGVIVAQVVPGSPADKAGLTQGDVILEMSGLPISNARGLSRAVAAADAGDVVDLQIWRRGTTKSLAVTIAAMPDESLLSNAQQPQKDASTPFEKSGLALAELDDRLRQQLGLPADEQGVVVINVLPGSPAQKTGLRPGDRIRQVAQREVDSLATLKNILAKMADSERLLLLVDRAGNNHFVALPIA